MTQCHKVKMRLNSHLADSDRCEILPHITKSHFPNWVSDSTFAPNPMPGRRKGEAPALKNLEPCTCAHTWFVFVHLSGGHCGYNVSFTGVSGLFLKGFPGVSEGFQGFPRVSRAPSGLAALGKTYNSRTGAEGFLRLSSALI